MCAHQQLLCILAVVPGAGAGTGLTPREPAAPAPLPEPPRPPWCPRPSLKSAQRPAGRPASIPMVGVYETPVVKKYKIQPLMRLQVSYLH